jgi:hypothetical protein
MFIIKTSEFTYAHRKTPQGIHFIYLGNNEIYCIFKTCYAVCVLFSTKRYLFHNFISLFSNNTFFIIHMLKFIYPLQWDKG